MSASTRADKLFSALSAKERALLALRAWKEGTEEDREVRKMPNDQIAEFNRLIEIMNGVNTRLGPYILLLRANVGQLGLIDGWLSTLLLWTNHVFDLETYIFCHAGEPVTESEYAAIKKASRTKTPKPDWGLEYEVFPDKDAPKVRASRDQRAHVRGLFKDVPGEAILANIPGSEPHNAPGDQIWQALVDRLRKGVVEYWIDTRAIESVLIEVTEEFDGVDPLLPEIRAILEWMNPELRELHEKLKTIYSRPFELPEPVEINTESIRKIAHLPSALEGNREITIDMIAEVMRDAVKASEPREDI
jgi:hypothetical protein